MLDKGGNEALHTAQYRTVYHNYWLLLILFTNVSNIKTLGQIRINLNSRTLPCPALSILKFNVYLGSIEYTFSRVYIMVNL